MEKGFQLRYIGMGDLFTYLLTIMSFTVSNALLSVDMPVFISDFRMVTYRSATKILIYPKP